MEKRILYIEKKRKFNIEGGRLVTEFRDILNVKNIKDVRVINKYIMNGEIDTNTYEKFKNSIFSEKNVDMIYDKNINLKGYKAFACQLVPGQFDKRADAAEQCMELLSHDKKCKVTCAKIVAVNEEVNDYDFNKIKNYYINPVDSKETNILGSINDEKPLEPDDVEVIENFITDDMNELLKIYTSMSLSMTFEDFKLCSEYFKKERRNPTKTEILVLDTYWSDHCRHTTFSTILKDIKIEEGKYTESINKSLNEYKDIRKSLKRDDKNITLMDIATIGAKELKSKGKLTDLDESEEINACTIKSKVRTDEGEKDYLILFKNETHNHPTEIEPFGGAATCLGGAIRDPLSGRAYVYGAMRVTGSADPRKPIDETLKGKLPQRVITKGAADGYSSYGNQIGLTTGEVSEIYHKGYVAKRMEVGAVIGAVPEENVRREEPCVGDVVLLLGGKTGRDGCGGATGSSKQHNIKSLSLCGAEVQKGNPVEERKIQRFFRNREVSLMIKRCNDFGAGGVSVAIGELCDGLLINLDAVPKKYEGLDGTEIAISESQERMAVVVSERDASRFKQLALKENLQCTKVAHVTNDKRLRMTWRGKTIVDLKREFLNTNGAKSYASVYVEAPQNECYVMKKDSTKNIKEKWKQCVGDLNVCSEKGLSEQFDSTIGANTILMPFGGKYRLTPTQGLALKVPVNEKESYTASLMTYGFNPYISEWSPYHGALYSVVESVCKIAAMGGDYRKVHLTFQEYFEKVGDDPKRWGKPFAALLGALRAQMELGVAAIGGKDSMSGTFENIDVPPTLISFAVALEEIDNVISPEFKEYDSKIAVIRTPKSGDVIDFTQLKENMELLKRLIDEKKVISAMALGQGGLAEALTKMALGNNIGIDIYESIKEEDIFSIGYGSWCVEIKPECESIDGIEIIGKTKEKPDISYGSTALNLEELSEEWQRPLESVFPVKDNIKVKAENILYNGGGKIQSPAIKHAKPRVIIPVFPGTNCEDDNKRMFERCGAIADTFTFRNIKPGQWQESIDELEKKIRESEILMIPGGFSAGDEPDGSGKFIANVLKNPKISDAVMDLIKNRDGLILGICNGFQALIKVGLLPYGEIRDLEENSPTLTFNNIGRHMSAIVYTKVVSKLSQWFNETELGHINAVPISHGEGRFVADSNAMKNLMDNGQIATQYVDLSGNAADSMPYNPNGSFMAVEGITSPDGRILGKMGHNERYGYGLYKNIPGDYDSKIFESGVNYFIK